jgi:predicted nuclease of predicted toxin-antitoxin system
MRILADENCRPAHVSALDSAGHDVKRVGEVLEKGASDSAVLAAGRDTGRIIVTYDCKDFADVTEHGGVFIAEETMAPREVRRTVERVRRAYPSLDDVVEFLADWR